MEKVSLDWDDEAMQAYYDRVQQNNSLRLHEFAVEHPAAAAQCVHTTFLTVITLLFSCAAPANYRPNKQFADGVPSRCEPGLLGHLAGYLGIVEPQQRYTEHIHMLVQLLGFAHPRDFFQQGSFIDMLRRVWCFVANILFESQEGFASYLGSESAMEVLRQSPLLEVRSQQRDALGAERVTESLLAQRAARGLGEGDLDNAVSSSRSFHKWSPQFLATKTSSPAIWAAAATRDSLGGVRVCGNHVCQKRVCVSWVHFMSAFHGCVS